MAGTLGFFGHGLPVACGPELSGSLGAAKHVRAVAQEHGALPVPQVASLQVEAVAASETLSPQPSHQRIVSQVDVYHRLMAAAAAAVAIATALLVERRGQED
uniref:Uncharacterized protein n=1 Tax=Oryza nivara TaxID=4536 RepID=A0A0E0H5E3_ORYNI